MREGEEVRVQEGDEARGIGKRRRQGARRDLSELHLAVWVNYFVPYLPYPTLYTGLLGTRWRKMEGHLSPSVLLQWSSTSPLPPNSCPGKVPPTAVKFP